MSFNKKLIIYIICITSIFILFSGLNLSPYLRGPGDWPPNWRWPYLFINTLNRIWMPLTVITLILSLFYFLEKKVKWNSFVLLGLLVTLSYLFQLSILYFGRSGISVLIHRIINPNLNGYFTEAIKIKNLSEFLSGYQNNVLNYSMHATGHPPGSVLFLWLIEKIINFIPLLKNLAVNLIPKHQDVKIIWNSLTITQRSTAVVSAFIIPIIGSLNIIPLFYIAKNLFDNKTALRSTVLAVFIPALTLFTPLSDVFFPIFFLTSFLFFIKGLKSNSQVLVFISGLLFAFGIFFSLSLLPLSFIYLLYLIKKKRLIFSFLTGLSIFYIIIFLTGYNVITVSYTLMTGLPKNRPYLIWTFYNLYDFFVFTGIPITITYMTLFFKKIREPLFVSFTLMILFLNFSGAVRGEVGRIWLPLMFPLVLVVGNFLTNKLKLTTKAFLIILIMQSVQILALQEFWVTLW
ncbi:glycosyltransferase family 39 protein [Candidatus Roizmanbacteria bacterium]|nr:glycosyltransferase family 39 protein [Candidatus Roizmanbacteria bacterium]